MIGACLPLPQADPNLKDEHGGVRVTYKLCIDDASEGATESEWLPLIETSDGKRVTDPKGLLFMSKGLVVDLSQPANSEPWRHGNVSDAEGLQKKDVWKKDKVLNDILRHRMVSFSTEERDQWRAINEFHHRFLRSDEVPNLPLTLRAGTLEDIRLQLTLVELVLRMPLTCND